MKVLVLLLLVFIPLIILTLVRVYAASTPDLGQATSFGILASTYTNTAIGTTIDGDLGYTTGPGVMPTVIGTTHVADGTYNQAGTDQATALGLLNAESCDFNFGSATNLSLLSQPLTPGVYCITGATSIGTGITLSGSGTYIFRITGALNTTADSAITLTNSASACDVFWTPSAATTLGANSTFIGTDIDAAGITIGSTVNWIGRALAFGGTVSTVTDLITVPNCVAPTSTPTSTLAPTSTPTETPTPTSIPTPTPTSTSTPTSTPTSIPTPTDTLVPTSTPIPTSTLAPTSTPTPASTSTPTPTSTPMSTSTPTLAPTGTLVPTSTPTPTPTSTLAPTSTPTETPTPTSAPTGTLVPTSTPTPTSSSTSSSVLGTTSNLVPYEICPTISEQIIVPVIIESKRVDADSISITWGPYSGTDKFNVRYGFEKDKLLYNVDVTGFLTTINDLHLNQPIWVQVAARNDCMIANYGESKLVGGPGLPSSGIPPHGNGILWCLLANSVAIAPILFLSILKK